MAYLIQDEEKNLTPIFLTLILQGMNIEVMDQTRVDIGFGYIKDQRKKQSTKNIHHRNRNPNSHLTKHLENGSP